MNKIRFLASLIALSCFCACSTAKSLSPEEAKKLLQENSEHVQDESFLMPTRLSLKSEATTKMFRDSGMFPTDFDYQSTTLIEYDQGKECFSRIQVEQTINRKPYGETTIKGYLYLWKEGGKYLTATSSISENKGVEEHAEHSWEELSSEEFHRRFERVSELYFPIIQKARLIEFFASLSENIDSFLEEQASPSLAPRESEHSMDGQYSSSGPGNLSVMLSEKSKMVSDDRTSYEESEHSSKIVFDSYLPICQSTNSSDIFRMNNGEIKNQGVVDYVMEYQWDVCNFRAPDLSLFPASEGGK